jgi:gluconate 2-dehydrogenase gamma chain
MSDQETRNPAKHIAEQRLDRRTLLQGTGAAVAAGSLVAAGAMIHPATAQDATPSAAGSPEVMASPMAGMPGMEGEGQVDPLADGFTHFPPPDAALIAAAAARIIPTDDNGPGATEAGVVYFIDRQLAKERQGYTGPIYERGPWVEGLPTQGDQSSLSIPDRFRIGISGMDAYAQQLYGANFTKLSTDQQDRILTDMEKGVPDTFDGTSIQSFPPVPMSTGTESTEAAGPVGIGAEAFFSLLKEYVMAGYFADPVHGGNRDMVGWKLIGFPGAQGFVYNDWILRFGEEFTGEYKSLAAYQQQVSGGE